MFLLIFLLIVYKIGGLFYLFQSVILSITIIYIEYIISYDSDSDLLIPRWIRAISYLFLYIIILILLNDLINIIIEKWQ
jgi:hypothetical protein